MQKKKHNTFKIIFASMFFTFFAFAFGQINLATNNLATDSSQQLALSSTHEVLNRSSIEGFSASYKENVTNVSGSEFEVTYSGNSYELEITVNSTSTTNYGYKWYYSKDNSDFTLIQSQEQSAIELTSCNQSGYYYCQVFDNNNQENISNAEVVEFNILPKTVTINTVEDKVFDGTKKVNAIALLNGVVSDDDVSAIVEGNTANENVDGQKYIYVDSIILTGEDKDNYKLSSDAYSTPIFINVTKLPTVLYWQTLGDKTTFTYNGSDQSTNITAYYENVKKERVYLSFNLKGNAIGFSKNYLNEFVNAGNYTATVILTESEANYALADSSGDTSYYLSINKIAPIVTIENTEFVYTGNQQDAKRCVSINNNEQTLKFKNNTFTTVEQGNDRLVSVEADESINYYSVKQDFKISVLKANSNIDITSVVKDYVYTGSQQVINSGAVIDNSEQTLQYLNNTFTTVKQGNNMIVTIYAPESANYNYALKSFAISVTKAYISTKGWYWDYSGDFIYSGDLKSVAVTNYNKDLVYPYYVDASFINAGTYTAKVNFYLNDPDNYYPIDFDDIVWTIKKATVKKPSVLSYQTTYNGQEQTFPVSTNDFYEVTNGVQKNAGNYNVCVSLKNNLNMQWEDSDSENLIIDWTINKITISQPINNQKLLYTGQEQSLSFENQERFKVINGTATNVGDYSAYLILVDANNYKWAGTDSAYIQINWEIYSDKSYNTVPVVVIVIISLAIIMGAIYVTLHFTIVAKIKRRKKLDK